MAKTDVWMPLYIGDYLSNTSRLTAEQHGVYLLIIMDYWVNGRPPNDDETLANIAKLSVERWLSIKPALIKYFTIENGELRQDRIESEKGKAEYLSNVRAVAGSKGGSKTQAKHQANAKANGKHGLTPSQSPSHSQSEPQLPSQPPAPKENSLVSPATPNRFDEFWQLYPVHRDKQKALKAWKSRKLDSIADQILHDVRERKRLDQQWAKGFTPHPTTYLNGSRWEDEFTGRQKKDGYQEFLESHDAAN